MSQSSLATAADYADAMLSLRRAKNWTFLLLLVCLLGQLAIFFLVHYGVVKPQAAAVPAASSQAVLSSTILRYLVGLTDFGGIILAVLLGITLLLITQIMVVGRLIGVGRLSSALIWSVILGLLIFPWQAFLNWQWLTEGFRLPGALYTWAELTAPRLVEGQDVYNATLLWGRFVVFPLVTLIVLLIVQARSTRGLRMALGETDLDAAVEPAAGSAI